MSVIKTNIDDAVIWVLKDEPEVVHRHPKNGPAVIRGAHSSYYFYGLIHRKDGPAIEFSNGNKTWYHFGLVHREDGPAMVSHDGKNDSFWFDGKVVNVKTLRQFKNYVKKVKSIKL